MTLRSSPSAWSLLTKRSVLLLLLLGLVPFGAGAQGRLFDVGFKAGVSSNDLSFGSGASTSTVLGWHAGVFARVKAPLVPGIQGEALFSTLGSEANSAPGTLNVRLDYVQLPVFLIFALGPLELHAGGYYGHPLGSSVQGTLEGIDAAILDDPDADYGLVGGLGLHVGRFYAGARYNYGLKDLNTGEGPDVHNRQAQLYAGIGLFK